MRAPVWPPGCWNDSPDRYPVDDCPLPPDLTTNRGPFCDAIDDDSGCVCTRLAGHGGRHAAGDGDFIVAVWHRGDPVSLSRYLVHDACGTGDEITTCGACLGVWCDRCDPAHGPLCPWCHGYGYSTAAIREPVYRQANHVLGNGGYPIQGQP